MRLFATACSATAREIVAVVDRPQNIEDEEAMSFFTGEEETPNSARGEGFQRRGEEINYAL